MATYHFMVILKLTLVGGLWESNKKHSRSHEPEVSLHLPWKTELERNDLSKLDHLGARSKTKFSSIYTSTAKKPTFTL